LKDFVKIVVGLFTIGFLQVKKVFLGL